MSGEFAQNRRGGAANFDKVATGRNCDMQQLYTILHRCRYCYTTIQKLSWKLGICSKNPKVKQWKYEGYGQICVPASTILCPCVCKHKCADWNLRIFWDCNAFFLYYSMCMHYWWGFLLFHKQFHTFTTQIWFPTSRNSFIVWKIQCVGGVVIYTDCLGGFSWVFNSLHTSSMYSYFLKTMCSADYFMLYWFLKRQSYSDAFICARLTAFW